MRRAVLLAAVLLLAAALPAAAHEVSGTVVDAVTREPLPGAAVRLEEDEGERELAADEKGAFRFETASDEVAVTAVLPGYRKETRTLSAPYASVVFALELSAEFTMGKVYVREQHQLEGSRQKVRSDQIRRTTAQIFPDSMKVLQTLPGVVTGNDFSSLMYVRGGEFYELLSFIDDVVIVKPYMWGGIQSVFNPSFVDRIDFYTGGFPVRYPQALSGVMDVRNVTGDYTRHSGFLEASPTTLEVFAQGPLARGRSSYVFGVRRTYYDLLLNLAYGSRYSDVTFPYFYDAQTKLSWKLNPRDTLSAELLASYEGMDFDSNRLADEDPDVSRFTFSYRDGRALPSVHFDRVWDEDTSMNLTCSVRRQEGASDLTAEHSTFTSGLLITDGTLRARFTEVRGRHTLEQGGYAALFDVDVRADRTWRSLRADGSYEYSSRSDRFNDIRFALGGVYAQDDVRLPGDVFTLSAGGLAERFDATGETSFSPRGGLTCAAAEGTTLKAVVGLYQQFPVNAGNDLPPYFRNASLVSEKAVHYVLGVEQELPRDLFLRVEGYRKDYRDRIVRDPDGTVWYRNSGLRKAWGADVFLQKKTGGRWDGWLAYSWLCARDKVLERSAADRALDYREPVGEWYPFDNERVHNLSLVVNRDFGSGWKLAVTARLAGGTPYTEVLGAVRGPGGEWVPVYGGYNGARLPPYCRVDAKLAIPFAPGSRFSAFVQIINLLGTENVDRYYYNDDYTERKTARMLPFIPIAGLRYEF